MNTHTVRAAMLALAFPTRAGANAPLGHHPSPRGRTTLNGGAPHRLEQGDLHILAGKTMGVCPGYVVVHVIPLKRGGGGRCATIGGVKNAWLESRPLGPPANREAVRGAVLRNSP
ncbi:exported hypothetical protein [Candidatus Sulfopaludibacter sp. SbA4]|nr:exported hypothetical protein [Candidatus Sulfopaludibacter sp. SbA4]